jgi:hypothetical protein
LLFFGNFNFIGLTGTVRRKKMPDPHNPHYDEIGVFYDSGFFYADGVPDLPTQNKKNKVMATKLKLGLSRRTPEDLVALAKHVHPKIAPAAPNVPPVAGVADEAAELLTACNEAEAANTAWANAKTALEAAAVTRRAKGDALRQAHDTMGSALETKSKGQEGPLSATGYELAGANTAATEPPAKANNLVVTAGDADGSLDAACDPAPRAHSYVWESTTVNPVSGPYTATEPTTASSTTLTGLTSGTRYWIRVAGVGAKGVGPWSDPVSKIAP